MADNALFFQIDIKIPIDSIYETLLARQCRSDLFMRGGGLKRQKNVKSKPEFHVLNGEICE